MICYSSGEVGVPLTADTKGRMLGLFILGIIVVCIGTNIASGITRSLVSERWPRASAQVVASAVYQDGRDVAPRWEPVVEYRYQIGNRTFTSRRIRFLMSPMYQPQEANGIAEGYSLGSVVQVAYNPANPSESVLEPGLPPGTLKQVLLVLFLLALTSYIYYEIRHPERRILLRSLPDSIFESRERTSTSTPRFSKRPDFASSVTPRATDTSEGSAIASSMEE
jgi:hypothetical protein